MIKIGKDIAKAVQKLKKGGIVVIPTETVYGLGAVSYTHLTLPTIYSV